MMRVNCFDFQNQRTYFDKNHLRQSLAEQKSFLLSSANYCKGTKID